VLKDGTEDGSDFPTAEQKVASQKHSQANHIQASADLAICLSAMAEVRAAASNITIPSPANSQPHASSFDQISERVAVLVITGSNMLHSRGTAVLQSWGRRIKHMTVASDEQENLPTLAVQPQGETFNAIQYLKTYDIQVPSGWAMKGLGHSPRWWMSQLKFLAAFDYFAGRWRPDHFEWYLYGDDDTYFFLDNVADYVAKLDHTDPHVIAHTFRTDPLMDPKGCGARQFKTFGHGGECGLSINII
jgi:hypothetical protein